jgi:hypothetical protein
MLHRHRWFVQCCLARGERQYIISTNEKPRPSPLGVMVLSSSLGTDEHDIAQIASLCFMETTSRRAPAEAAKLGTLSL